MRYIFTLVMLMALSIGALAGNYGLRIEKVWGNVFKVRIGYDTVSKIGDSNSNDIGYLRVMMSDGKTTTLVKCHSYWNSNSLTPVLNWSDGMMMRRITDGTNDYFKDDEWQFSKNKQYEFYLYMPYDTWNKTITRFYGDGNVEGDISDGYVDCPLTTKDGITLSKINNGVFEATIPICNEYAYNRAKGDKGNLFLSDNIEIYAKSDGYTDGVRLFSINGKDLIDKGVVEVRVDGGPNEDKDGKKINGCYLEYEGKYYQQKDYSIDSQKDQIKIEGNSYTVDVSKLEAKNHYYYLTVRCRVPQYLRSSKAVTINPRVKCYIGRNGNTSNDMKEIGEGYDEDIINPLIFSATSMMSTPTVSKVFLNQEAGSAETAGAQNVLWTSVETPEKITLYRIENGKHETVSTLTTEEEIETRLLSVPYSDKKETYYLELTMPLEEKATENDICYTDVFEIDPYKRLYKSNDAKLGQTNIVEGNTARIGFETRHTECDDLFPSDALQLIRAYDKEDLSAASAIKNIMMSDTYATSDGKELYLIEDTTAWEDYLLSDINEEADWVTNIGGEEVCAKIYEYNKKVMLQSEEKTKSILESHFSWAPRRVYYRVQRAIAANILTQDAAMEPYRIDYERVMFEQLPTIDKIKVEKDAENWDANKCVNVTMTMKNKKWLDIGLCQTDDTPERLNTWDSKNAKIKLRFRKTFETPDGKKYEPEESEIEINGNEVEYDQEEHEWTVTYQLHLSDPFTHYEFEARVDGSKSIYPYMGGDAYTKYEGDDFLYEDAADIYDFVASEGTDNMKIHVSWRRKEGNFVKYELRRRAEEETEWETLEIDTSLDPEQSYYIDYKKSDESINGPERGSMYVYEVTYVRELNGHKITTTKTATGWLSQYIELSGRVMAKSGSGKTVAIPNLQLQLKPKDGLEESVQLKNLNTRLVTDEKGYYKVTVEDKIKISKYNLNVSSDIYSTSDFKDINGNSLQTLDFTDVPTKTCNLYNSTTANVSGRVMYEGSTIPVRNANFVYVSKSTDGKETETLICDGNGTPVTTNATGNFDFTIPAGTYQIKVVREGHTFADGGYIKGTSENTSYDAGDTEKKYPYITLANSEEIAQLRLWDATKVVLKGRIQAGNSGDNLKIGNGWSQNYIGDDLKLTLMLEGDNTSHIVSDLNNDEVTRREKVINHNASDQFSTKTEYELKHIYVYPDTKSGEFFVELYPVKYKVTEITAHGYSTLFNQGETIKTLDLTDVTDEESDALTYIHRYYSPLEITYQQRSMGILQDYFGVEKVEVESDTDETKYTIELAKKNSDGGYDYTLGYPVFASDQETGIKNMMDVHVHRDYYYNNSKGTNGAYTEDVNNVKLKVYNGLCDNANNFDVDITNNGRTTFRFDVHNTTFSRTGDDALRELNMSVENNGYTYHAEPLRAFVMGSQTTGSQIGIADGDITIHDVLYDPQGAGSYSWLAEGKHYSYERSMSLKGTINFTLGFHWGTSSAYSAGSYAGSGTAGVTTSIQYSSESGTGFEMNIPVVGFNAWKKASYDATFTTKLQTSGEHTLEGIGANADLYIGSMQQVSFSKINTITLLNEEKYRLLQPSIKEGTTKIISEGTDNGHKIYLAVTPSAMANPKVPTTFAYSQYYIMHTILPELYNRLSELVVFVKDETEARKIANQKKTRIYYITDTPENFNEKSEIKHMDFNGSDKDAWIDNVPNIVGQINQWQQAIARSEMIKLAAMEDVTRGKTYNVSGTSTIEHTENADYMISGWDCYATGVIGDLVTCTASGVNHSLSKLGIDVSNQIIKSFIENHIDTSGPQRATQKEGKPTGNRGDTTDSAENKTVSVFVPGFRFKFEFTPYIDFSLDDDGSGKTTTVGETGFSLNAGNEQSSISVSAQNLDLKSIYGDKNLSEEQKETIDWIMSYYLLSNKTAEKVTNKVFIPLGGASRAPYMAPDSTIFFKPGTQIGYAMLKVDNPVVTIDNPILSDIPSDEAAVLMATFSNESELKNIKPLTPTSFVVQTSGNSEGLELSIDGMPIPGEGYKLYMMPGDMIKKTIKVRRGTAFDYEDIHIYMYPEDDAHNCADASFSVHFVPESSPVSITSIKENWVLNTYASKDDIEKLYYMPVEIGGFNIQTRNFDHIEFQYKPTMGSDADWVNLCSYYADEELYERATGTKEMIKSSTIKAKFFGERDPMEMKYDLRAVSFCRYGDGYVTKSSEVLTGMKDTRRPEVFGKPQPGNGILTCNDNVKLMFSESIAYNYLDEDNNFRIFALTNATTVNDETALNFRGDTTSVAIKAESELSRNLSGRNFSVDMLVMPSSDRSQTVFSHGDDKTAYMTLGLVKESDATRIELKVGKTNGATSTSTTIKSVGGIKTNNLSTTYHHLVMTYVQYDEEGELLVDNEGKPTRHVNFYWDGELLKAKIAEGENDVPVYTGNGPIRLGYDFAHRESPSFGGRMREVRLWSYELPSVIAHSNAEESIEMQGYEHHLVARYPLDETSGDIAKDMINGADIALTGLSWYVNQGYSLRLENRGLTIAGDEKSTVKERFNIGDENDYTMTFWYKSDVGNEKPYTIFSAGDATKNIKLGVASDTMYFYQSGKNLITFTKPDDGKWHHVAMTTNRADNVSNIYIDRQIVYRGEADNFIGIPVENSKQNVTFGSDKFVGNIDNVTLWSAALPSAYLDEIWDNIPSGDEPSLVVSLPFEQSIKGSNNLYDIVPSLDNEISENYNHGKKVTSEPAFEVSDINEIVSNEQSYVKRVSPKGNIKFNWSSTGNDLLIDIKSMPSKINHNNVYFMVKDVEDMYGNMLANPIIWSVYVDINKVKWVDENVSVVTGYAEEREIDAEITNVSGEAQYYTIYSDASWLRFDGEKSLTSKISPNETKSISITIPNTLNPGEYDEMIYVETPDSLNSIMNLKLKVNPIKPKFEIDRSLFSNNMSLRGSVKLYNSYGGEYLDDDKEDIVIAMKGQNVVGKAEISTNGSSEANVYMTIYGAEVKENASSKDEEIRFYLLRSVSGNLYRLTPSEPIKFKCDTTYGIPPASKEPVKLTCSSSMVQTIKIEKGWNWISTYLKSQASTLSGSFLSNSEFVNGDYIKTSNSVAAYSAAKNRWSDSKNTGTGVQAFNNSTVYRLYSKNGGLIYYVGDILSDEERQVKVAHGWNDLPYLLNTTQPINSALGDYSMEKGKAQDGDIVKSLDQFAVMTDGEWVGTLTTLRPGQGYLLRRGGEEETTIKYQSSLNKNESIGNKSLTMTDLLEGIGESYMDDKDRAETNRCARQYGNHMIMIAEISDPEQTLSGDNTQTLLALADGKVVGEARATYLANGKAVYLMSVFAESDAVLKFAVAEGDKIVMSENTMRFSSSAPAGSIVEPYIVKIGSDETEDGPYYDISGMRVSQYYRGVVVTKGKKMLKK